MKSIRFKTVEGVLGCLLPLIFGIFVFALFMAMIIQEGTGIGVLQGAFCGFVLGLVATIVVNLLFYPVNRAIMACRLKKGGDNIDRLACWHDPRTGITSYLASNGFVTGDETYYWGGVYMTLEGVHLEQKPSGLVMVVSLGRQMTGRSTHYFNAEIPVPEGKEEEAQTVARQMLQDNSLVAPSDRPGRH